MKAPIARKLAVRHTISKYMHGLQTCLFKYITVAAFRIYVQHIEYAAKRGGWKTCIK